ncbi:MAG: 4Fe-4S dicluster domain-containing protein [Candidatus Methanomethylicaceae archaeon]|jgi:ferredoxin
MPKLTTQDILKLIDGLRAEGFEVISPLRINGVVKLAKLPPGEAPLLDYIRINNSPKDFLLPCRESLYKYRSTATLTSYGLKIRFPTAEGPCPVTIMPECTLPKSKIAFFGIHPCMVNSIRYLDKVMLSDPADPYYKGRRDGMFIAVMECEEGDDYCLCGMLDSYKVPAGYADLMMRKRDGGFLVRAASEGGKGVLALINKTQEKDGVPELVPKMKEKYTFDSTDEAEIDRRDAKEYVELCTLCAACTVTCPTCYCGDIEDEFSLMDPANVERTRLRMSCQRKCYSMIAGGTTFLKTKDARFKWRLKHKFPFSERAYQLKGCIGCGNCIAMCPARIDFRKFLGRREA